MGRIFDMISRFRGELPRSEQTMQVLDRQGTDRAVPSIPKEEYDAAAENNLQWCRGCKVFGGFAQICCYCGGRTFPAKQALMLACFMFDREGE